MDTLASYDAPYVRAFDAAPFRKAAARALATCEDRLRAIPGSVLDTNPLWGYLRCPKDAKQYRREGMAWQPKVYVCVGPRDYFSTVTKLLNAFEHATMRLKFYRAPLEPWPASYGRPDKIVFYPRKDTNLRSLIRTLRTLVVGASVHPMRHAATPYELGLEREPKDGIRIGCDPMFLKDGPSWRGYRTLVCAFAEANRDYFERRPRGLEGWLDRMNVSTRHEGPRSLSPPQADRAYVKRYWSFLSEFE